MELKYFIKTNIVTENCKSVHLKIFDNTKLNTELDPINMQLILKYRGGGVMVWEYIASGIGKLIINVRMDLTCIIEYFKGEYNITSKEHLKEILKKEWNNIQLDDIKVLILSMSSKLQAVIHQEGNYTEY